MDVLLRCSFGTLLVKKGKTYMSINNNPAVTITSTPEYLKNNCNHNYTTVRSSIVTNYVLNVLFTNLYRFRSVAMSYFRRADGVLLLYDVTYERSFLNVRDWLDSIEVCTPINALLLMKSWLVY